MSKIKRIPGTVQLDDFAVKTSLLKPTSSTSFEPAIHHALFRAKKQNKAIRIYQAEPGKKWIVSEATEKLPKTGTYYDVYKDSTVWR